MEEHEKLENQIQTKPLKVKRNLNEKQPAKEKKKRQPDDVRQFADVGARLREIREDLGWTQAIMAEEFGLSKLMIQNYEAGWNLVSVVGMKVLSVLGYDVNWLLSESNSMKINTHQAIGYNPEILSDLILQTEKIIEENEWAITVQNKVNIITRLFATYNHTGEINSDELKWALGLANTNWKQL